MNERSFMFLILLRLAANVKTQFAAIQPVYLALLHTMHYCHFRSWHFDGKLLLPIAWLVCATLGQPAMALAHCRLRNVVVIAMPSNNRCLFRK